MFSSGCLGVSLPGWKDGFVVVQVGEGKVSGCWVGTVGEGEHGEAGGRVLIAGEWA